MLVFSTQFFYLVVILVFIIGHIHIHCSIGSFPSFVFVGRVFGFPPSLPWVAKIGVGRNFDISWRMDGFSGIVFEFHIAFIGLRDSLNQAKNPYSVLWLIFF